MSTIYLAIIVIALLILIYYRAERRAERSRAWVIWTATLYDYLTGSPVVQVYYGDQLQKTAPAPQLPPMAAALGDIQLKFAAGDAKQVNTKINQLYTAAESWTARDGQIVDNYLDSLIAIVDGAVRDDPKKMLAARDMALQSAAQLGALTV